jgi:uncharacterized delta-60 repeat protein
VRKVAILPLAVLLGAGAGAEADGMLDPSFGNAGLVTTPFFPGSFSYDGAGSLVVLPDGRAVAAGRAGDIKPPGAMAAARYLPSGALDTTFGSGGLVTLGPTGCEVGFGGPGSGAEVALRASGVVRLLPNGAPDSSFDGDGLVTSDFGADETGRSVILLGDGRLVLGGYRGTSPLTDFALVRYLADGTLDTSFGTGGLAIANPGGQDFAKQVIELPNGKLILVGTANSDFLLARFHTDGALDTSFGTAGFLQTAFPGSMSEGCAAVAIVGPDLILTAGSAWPTGGTTDFALARYIATIPVELLSFEVQ